MSDGFYQDPSVDEVHDDRYHFCEICKGLANHKTSRHPWPSRSEATDEPIRNEALMAAWRGENSRAMFKYEPCALEHEPGRVCIRPVGHDGSSPPTAPDLECLRCGGPNVAWAAASPLWNLVMREGSINGPWKYKELVCVRCFIALAEEAGVTGVWRLTVTPEPGGMESATPSGRVWNRETWLWDEPTKE